jgi:hypothetical protein
MATPPTFVAEVESVYSTSADKSVSVSVNAGDTLVVAAVGGDWEAAQDNILTPTGGGLTYAPAASVTLAAFCQAYMWTATSSTTQSFTLSVAMNGGASHWGISALQFSGVQNIGNAGADHYTGAHTGSWLDLTSTDTDSVVVIANGDWNSVDGASRVWRTVNGITPAAGAGETTYYHDALTYTAYVAYYSDAGAVGSNTYGQSTPSGQKYSIVGVELVGFTPLQPFHLPAGHHVLARQHQANF